MSAKMRTVSVKASNLKTGDVVNGARVLSSHAYKSRSGHDCVFVVTPNPAGYGRLGLDFIGSDRVKARRPRYNMG